jgi:hypothetical protein
MKSILESTFKSSLIAFNTELEVNIKNNGKFSVIFDIWTSNSQTAFMGVIISFIDSNFNLIYKLIGFEEIIDRHTGLNIFNSFLNILNPYPSITLSNILRYIYSSLKIKSLN